MGKKLENKFKEMYHHLSKIISTAYREERDYPWSMDIEGLERIVDIIEKQEESETCMQEICQVRHDISRIKEILSERKTDENSMDCMAFVTDCKENLQFLKEVAIEIDEKKSLLD